MRRSKIRAKQRRRPGLFLLAIGILFLVAVFSRSPQSKLLAQPENYTRQTCL